jgi:CTD kinase subunit gamma
VYPSSLFFLPYFPL